jgi:hypothetical protein
MTLVVAPEAAAQILVRKQWWRANRSKAPERFDEGLAVALAAIRERPESFPVFSARGGRTRMPPQVGISASLNGGTRDGSRSRSRIEGRAPSACRLAASAREVAIPAAP